MKKENKKIVAQAEVALTDKPKMTDEQRAARREKSLQRIICATRSTGNQRVDMAAAKIFGQAFRHRESISKGKAENSYIVHMENGVDVTVTAEVNPNSEKGQMRYAIQAGKVTIPGAFARKTFRVCEKALNPHARGPKADRFDASEVDDLTSLLGL